MISNESYLTTLYIKSNTIFFLKKCEKYWLPWEGVVICVMLFPFRRGLWRIGDSGRFVTGARRSPSLEAGRRMLATDSFDVGVL